MIRPAAKRSAVDVGRTAGELCAGEADLTVRELSASSCALSLEGRSSWSDSTAIPGDGQGPLVWDLHRVPDRRVGNPVFFGQLSLSWQLRFLPRWPCAWPACHTARQTHQGGQG